MVKAVIFDMDGILIDSLPIHMKIWGIIEKELGFKIRPEEGVKFNGMSLREMITYLKKNHDIPATSDEIYEMKMRLQKEMFWDEVTLFKGVEDLLKELNTSGIRCAVATSSERYFMDMVVDKFDIRGYFSGFVSCDDVKKAKPEPEIFLLAAKRSGTKPKECVVIEDAPNGITAAKKAGMKSIAVMTTHTEDALHDADLIVNSIDEISLSLLKNI
ncbi:MAG: phosphatase [Chloroflexi bacterium CG08_land_8_20_14_0_20_45_12]|nr:MAG: phosphatase [Chloroflexi bacterium CG08_land_8_20_14_0_20_45_12]